MGNGSHHRRAHAARHRRAGVWLGDGPQTAGVRHTPELDNPWPIPLSGPAMLLPSTTNTHLFIDSSLSWPTYRRMLRRLVRHRLLEPAYVAASEARQATHLRLPWISKSHPLHLPGVAAP